MADLRSRLRESANKTKAKFAAEISSITRLKDTELVALIDESGIAQKDLASLIAAVKDATTSNQQKATNIKNITKGVEALVGLAKKLV